MDPASDFKKSCGSLRFVGTFELRDGRQLTYSFEGDGVPVVALHGMCSSRMTWNGAMPLARVSPGVRLIAVDRPGYGGSSPPPPMYSYTAFAADVAELADLLGLDTFCVAGHSSGGPYALALAAALPSRVLACAAISSDPPYSHPQASLELRLSDSMAFPANNSSGESGLYGLDPHKHAEEMRVDAMKNGPERRRYAFQQGTGGFVCDFMLERSPWSFMLERIKLGSALTFWVGSEDFPAMVLGAPFMHGLVADSQLRVVPGGDHGFKSHPEHLANILQELSLHWHLKRATAM